MGPAAGCSLRGAGAIRVCGGGGVWAMPGGVGEVVGKSAVRSSRGGRGGITRGVARSVGVRKVVRAKG